MHPCRVSDGRYMLVRRCVVFFCLLPHRWFPLLLAVVKGLPDLLRWYTLAALHQGYLQPLSTWRTAMIIRPPPSLPLSPPVRLNGSHVSPRPPRLMYSLLIWKRLGRSVHFFFFALRHVKYNQQELCSLYVVNEYNSIEGLSAVQFIVCSITQPEKWGEACSF